MSKAHAGTGKVVYCPNCDFPRQVRNQRHVTCRQCKLHFEVDYDDKYGENKSNRIKVDRLAHKLTIAAIDAIEYDNIGRYCGWATCPQCERTISKGDGCDNVRCVCGKRLSWSAIVEPKEWNPSATVKRLFD